MKKLIFFVVISLFLFSGCSTSPVDKSSNKDNISLVKENEKKDNKSQVEVVNEIIKTVNNGKSQSEDSTSSNIPQENDLSGSKEEYSSKALSIAKLHYPEPEYIYSPDHGGNGEMLENTYGDLAHFFTFKHAESGLYGVWVSNDGSCYARNIDY